MSFISMTDYESASAEVRAEYDDQIARHGRITNMKRTLLHDVPSFKAYMEWYTLYDELVPVVGERAMQIYSYVISTGNDCLVCGSFFTKILEDRGEDPSALELTETENLLSTLGAYIVKDPHNIPDVVYVKLKERFSEREIVALIAFGGLMYATNLFNTVCKVDLDEVLEDHRYDKYKETDNG